MTAPADAPEPLGQRAYTGRAMRTSTTGIRGVSLNPSTGKYRAQIQIDGRRRYLGAFDTADEAASAYRAAAGGEVRKPTSPYLHRYVNGRSVKEHRAIWEAAHGPVPAGYQIDHIDGDKHNNALSNLRLATAAQNQWNKGATGRNTTGFKGVIKDRKSGRYIAFIRVNGPSIRLGSFGTPEEAAAAYDAAAIKHHGAFARINGALPRSEGST